MLAVQHGSGAAVGSVSGPKSPFTASLNPHVVCSLFTCIRLFKCTGSGAQALLGQTEPIVRLNMINMKVQPIKLLVLSNVG